MHSFVYSVKMAYYMVWTITVTLKLAVFEFVERNNTDVNTQYMVVDRWKRKDRNQTTSQKVGEFLEDSDQFDLSHTYTPCILVAATVLLIIFCRSV